MGAPAAPATASVRAGSVGLYRPRRPRASTHPALLWEGRLKFLPRDFSRGKRGRRPSWSRALGLPVKRVAIIWFAEHEYGTSS